MAIIPVLNSIIIAGFMLVGLVVVLKNSKARLNRLFFSFATTASAWVIANYFSNNFDISYQAALVANHLTLFIPGVVLLFLLGFILLIGGAHRISKKWIAYIFLSLIGYSLTLTNIVFSNIHKQGNVYAIDFTNFAYIYFITLFINMIVIVVVLARSRSRSKGLQREQLTTILWGVSLLLAVNVATNALLPAVVDSFSFTNLGPISCIFVIFALWYSIVKHRLFDIRLIIARSFAYVLSLSSLAAVFTLGTFGLTSIFFQNSQLSDNQIRLIYTILAVILAFLFAPIRRFFDKITSRIFYRDAYDSQAFLDDFNKLLVSTIELNRLLNKLADIIQDNLKPTFVEFVLNGHERRAFRTFGRNKASIDPELLSPLSNELTKMKTKLTLTDELDADNQELSSLLRHANIDMAVKLSASSTSTEHSVGYLVLGPKKSGNVYSNQDKKVIEIVANELVIAIQNALRFEEIENFNKTLQDKVDDATHKLRQANIKLKAVDESKDEFISMASHQLRTPLTAIKGYSSMLLDGEAGDKLNKIEEEFLRQTFNSSQRMVGLISDLLNLSRLKTGKFIIEREPCDLVKMIDEELEQVGEIAQARGLKLTFSKPHKFPVLQLDELKTRQVIMNFIDNALHYTREGGHIEISLLETDNDVTFKVIDNGIGVPDDQKHKLFTKFFRAENAQAARPDGTGIGLFMAKKAIEAQGGSIIFQSKYNEGSTFGFKFPKNSSEENKDKSQ